MMDYFFLLLLFIVALLYAGVGHGGASGYLALMAVWGLAPAVMKPAALILNVLVSAIAFIQFIRNEKLEVRLFLALIIASIPAAYMGATMPLGDQIYKLMLGLILVFQSLRLSGILFPLRDDYSLKSPSYFTVMFTGGFIGLLSGMIGIGGGIILSPLMVSLRWTTLRQTALISAGFIFLNSISGLMALSINAETFSTDKLMWLVVAFSGGLLGSWIGSKKYDAPTMKKVLALVIFIAGIKLILG